ncbi:hypothetical protein KKG90_00425, partial [Candidatus Bipolaricaulota bacterium]|nr:hypothetical protein [Candidatus Bipolaricaulota bacterium]
MIERHRLERRMPLRFALRTFPGILFLALALCLIAGMGTAIAQELGMLRFEASGPIQIEVHDPLGNIVSRDVVQIEGASFVDVDAAITIEIPNRILGDYLVHMNVDGSANRLQHFYISVTDGVETIQLADFQLIVNAPVDPFVIRSTADGFTNVTDLVDDEASGAGSSSTMIWIIAGAAGLIAAGVLVLVARSRKK